MLLRINLFFLLVLVTTCSCSNNQKKEGNDKAFSNEGKAPKMDFQGKNIVDLGKIKEGEKIKHTYEFINTGNAPLQISYANASCGCTIPSWPKEEIPVGGKGAITVEFNSKNKAGKNFKKVSVYANTQPEFNTVAFNIEVIK
ncbi:MAG: DUF1573 domain-containing protein [Bacteroidota bacterium]